MLLYVLDPEYYNTWGVQYLQNNWSLYWIKGYIKVTWLAQEAEQADPTVEYNSAAMLTKELSPVPGGKGSVRAERERY